MDYFCGTKFNPYLNGKTGIPPQSPMTKNEATSPLAYTSTLSFKISFNRKNHLQTHVHLMTLNFILTIVNEYFRIFKVS